MQVKGSELTMLWAANGVDKGVAVGAEMVRTGHWVAREKRNGEVTDVLMSR